MNTVTYRTGRNYGTSQILEITFAPTDDIMSDVPATFVDAARGISGTVTVFGFDATPNTIGPAVLAEYDAGRYVTR
jgi:hypothetical protein